MTALLALPAALAVVAGLVAAWPVRRLPPAAAAVGTAVSAAVGAVAVIAVVTVPAGLAMLRLEPVQANLEWCRSFASDHAAPLWAVVVLLAAGCAMAVRMCRARPRREAARAARAELVVLPTPQPYAFAVPGRPGHVVVSVGMLRQLDAHERRVLLAHERSHLRRRHHLHLAVVDVAAAAVPLLGPLRRRVRFAVERWADEDAAAATGDRALVARTICRAALAGGPGAELSLAGLGVPARVEALLRQRSPSPLATAAAGLATVVVGASAVWQLHHLLVLAVHLCTAR